MVTFNKNILNFITSRLTIYILLIFLMSLLFESCQPSVRFASKIQTKTKTMSKSVRSSKLPAQNSEDLSSFKTGKEFNDAIITEAESWLGVRYQYGGTSKSGVDCSGFVQKVYEAVGTQLPRTSNQQFDSSERIDFVDKQSGDLIFFRNQGKVSHVGIYLGQGYMIHSSTSSGVVKQSIHDSYFLNRVAGVGRFKSSNLSKSD